eukprot:1334904-Pyramimonas_sp.AAC.1
MSGSWGVASTLLGAPARVPNGREQDEGEKEDATGLDPRKSEEARITNEEYCADLRVSPISPPCRPRPSGVARAGHDSRGPRADGGDVARADRLELPIKSGFSVVLGLVLRSRRWADRSGLSAQCVLGEPLSTGTRPVRDRGSRGRATALA